MGLVWNPGESVGLRLEFSGGRIEDVLLHLRGADAGTAFGRFVDESQSGFPFAAARYCDGKSPNQPSRWSLSMNLTALGKHVLGNQANGQCDQSRNNDQIIQMSEDGDKIWN